MKKRIKGFTLIELLATVIILAIVLLIAVPQVLNIINKTRKSAFAADAIIAGKEAVNMLNESYVKGLTELPEEGKSVPVDIDSLNNEDLNKYTGQVIIKRESGKLIPYVTMNDGSNYVCNTAVEYINQSSVTKDSECILPLVREVNEPVLVKGMTPIIWDENGNVKDTTKNDPSWYDYTVEAKKWANARTEDGSMWVWIPRYAYQITNGYHTSTAGTIEVKFLKGTTNTGYDGTESLAVNQGNNPGSDTNFVTHPAFKFGNDEVAGIWIMKFEASNNDGIIASVPNVASWRSKTTDVMFDLSRSMETNSAYGWGTTGNGIDTHMLKDVEWGAAAYLSWSTYGKTSEVWINSSTQITGCADSSVSAAGHAGCTFAYNTVDGQKASTTGNYYGIYDMSGGAYEATASYLIGGGANLTTYGASLLAADSKYVDRYVGASAANQTNYNLNTGYYGNAIYETSSQGSSYYSWNSDYSRFMISSSPFSARGGYCSTATYAGVFNFDFYSGASNTLVSWRTSVAVKEGL